MVVALIISLFIACASAFMYLPANGTNWGNATSSVQVYDLSYYPHIWAPEELAAAYQYPHNQNNGYGMTIAVTVFGNCSYAESDLAQFNERYGFPPCTFANGCLNKITVNGDHNWPGDNQNWDIECSIDIQTIHQTAPRAKILIVTSAAGDTDGHTMLQTLVYAGQHADYVTASWGSAEGFSPVEDDLKDAISKYGTTFFAATGDSGSQNLQSYPASSAYVIAVGGTQLDGSDSNPTETGWPGSGGGCSTVYTASVAQSENAGYQTAGCNGMRGVPDIAFDAGGTSVMPGYTQATGWAAFGGTSLSSPRAAAMAAVRYVQITPDLIYGGGMSFRDITDGSNGGHVCKVGYDLVTGMGAWTSGLSGTYNLRPNANAQPPFDGPEGCGNGPVYDPDTY